MDRRTRATTMDHIREPRGPNWEKFSQNLLIFTIFFQTFDFGPIWAQIFDCYTRVYIFILLDIASVTILATKMKALTFSIFRDMKNVDRLPLWKDQERVTPSQHEWGGCWRRELRQCFIKSWITNWDIGQVKLDRQTYLYSPESLDIQWKSSPKVESLISMYHQQDRHQSRIIEVKIWLNLTLLILQKTFGKFRIVRLPSFEKRHVTGPRNQ